MWLIFSEDGTIAENLFYVRNMPTRCSSNGWFLINIEFSCDCPRAIPIDRKIETVQSQRACFLNPVDRGFDSVQLFGLRTRSRAAYLEFRAS